jgi:circadian clock protein KaiC
MTAKGHKNTREPRPPEGDPPRAGTGIGGLDDILAGGLPAGRLYLIQGNPGTGKTTLALQFALEGAKRGERVLYITLAETGAELRDVARSHGWDLGGVEVYELPASEQLQSESHHTIFHPAEVELTETTRALLAVVERIRPTRVVFDSLSEIRLLAGDAVRFRRQVLSLKNHFAGSDTTVMLLDDRTADGTDTQLQSLVFGAIVLEQRPPTFGPDHRRLRVVKVRGSRYRAGYHDFTIERGGLSVYPRLTASEHREEASTGAVPSGLPALDALLGGGLDRGTSTLLMGPAGSGKSTIAGAYAHAAALRGERSIIFLFDERPPTYFQRAAGLGLDLRPHVASGLVTVQQVDPAEFTVGEFSHHVRNATTGGGAGLVVIDSLNGYLNAMAEERLVTIQLHELLSYLGQRGITSLMTCAQHGLLGSMQSPVDISYLADTVLLFRYFECEGEVRQAISVFKKRGGAHERSIRPLRMGGGGVHIGAPLRHYRGVLTGVPLYTGGDPEAPAERP